MTLITKRDELKTVSYKFPQGLIQRIDRLTVQLKNAENDRITKADTVREAIERGLSEIETALTANSHANH